MTVLWVILWIILGLLGLVLALLVLAVLLMFVPIKYELTAAHDGQTTAYLRVSYLFRLIYVVYDYGEDVDKLTVRIAGIRVNRGKKPVVPGKEKSATAEMEATPSPPSSGKETKKSSSSGKEPGKKKSSSFKAMFGNAKQAWKHPHRKAVTKLSLRTLKQSMRVLKPKKIDVHGAIALGDPANTGLMLGAYEIAAGLFGFRRHVRLVGDFEAEDAFIRFNAYVLGYINIGRTAMPFVRLALKKPVRSIIWQAIN